ncbi:MAG: response regulator [Caldilineaceae bacterium]|nr:response regulator [Caldilineaceae bacterium]
MDSCYGNLTPCTILVVDDDWVMLELLTDVLTRDGNTVLTAADGEEAIRICREQQVEVMILDYMMPGISGEDVVHAVRKFEPDIQIILQTAMDTLPARKMLRALDIQGFHSKGDQLAKLLMWTDVAIKNYEQIRSRRDLEESLLALGLALEARDLETAGHTNRVVKMAELMGRQHGLNRRRLGALRQGAYLHDIGKLCISDEILLKPSKLTQRQWEIMQTHAKLGHDLAARIPNIKPEALEVILYHHERWDGLGYPAQLRQEEIPLLARIFAICDVFDALVSPRVYKPPWAEVEAIRELHNQRAKQFDPAITDMFIKLWSEGAFDDIDPTTPATAQAACAISLDEVYQQFAAPTAAYATAHGAFLRQQEMVNLNKA